MIIKRGPLVGKRVECAPQTGVDAHRAIAVEFMRRVVGLEPDAWMITDESHLRDFATDELPLKELQNRAIRIYGLKMIPGNLLETFKVVQGLGFSAWLLEQDLQQNDVGRLARLARDDREWPTRAGDLVGYYITHIGRSPYFDPAHPEWQYEALYDAMDEFDKLRGKIG